MEGVQVKIEPITDEVFISEVDVEENQIKQEFFDPEVDFEATDVLFSEIDAKEHLIKLEPVKDLLDCLSKFSTQQDTDVKPPVERKLLNCQVVVPKLLECELCGFYSNNKVELATHVEAHQPTDCDHSSNKKSRIAKKFKCIRCGVKYGRREMWDWHLTNCHGPTRNVKVIQISKHKHNFQCVRCGATHTTLRKIIPHLRVEHNLEHLPFPCNKCNLQFSRVEHAKRHQLTCKFTKLKYWRNIRCNQTCNQCSVTFTQPEFLVWHSEFCHGKNPLVKIIKENGKKTNFQCIECGTVCKYLFLIVGHLRSQHKLEKMPFHCTKCDKRFALRTQLHYHLRLCNVKSSKTVFVNPSINKKIKTELGVSNVDVHKFKCIHCDHGPFTTFSQLEFHCDSRHHGKHYFECDICQAEFYSHFGYIAHKKYKHLGSVFPCSICSAKFWNPSSLNTHIKSVHSTTPVSCKLCSATFKCETYLKKHIQRMHTGLILSCAHCDYTTRSKSHIIKHLRRSHFY